jgi:hypothetical protein
MSKKLICLTCFVLVLSVAGSTSAQLIAHYKLDETEGTVVNDSSGKDNHAEIDGDPVWIEGLKDGALEFDGDDFVTLPAENMGLRSDAGSVAFWMKMPAEDLTGINTLWWGGDNTTGTGMGPENEMHIHVESTVANIWIGGEICFRVKHTEPLTHLHSDPLKGDAANPGNEPNDPILVNTDQWYHVAGTWGDAEGNIKLYLDGELLQQAAYDPISYPLSYMYLGQMAAGNRMYTGSLDEVQIYGRALTQEEIQTVIAGDRTLTLTASQPKPANQAVEVGRDVVLKWTPGDTVDKHNVYLGTVFEDVNEASTTDTRHVLVSEGQDELTFTPPNLLDFGQTYYWRVDEVNAPPDAAVNKGDVWSFTIANFVIVDDFESYTDYQPSRIFDVWLDGYGNPNNGSTVGYPSPDFANDGHFVETNTVRSGKQSMPYLYDNTTAGNSEATLPLSSQNDWTEHDINSLTLWLRGNPTGFKEEPAGTYTINAMGEDIWSTNDEFRFVYKQMSGPGSIVAKVESIEDIHEWSKAGVMIRQTVDAGSKFAAVYITPGQGCRFQGRLTPTTDATSDTEVATEEQMAITAPYWIKLERTEDDQFNGYYSEDGVNWVAMSWNPQNIAMPDNVYVGMAVTSHLINAWCQAVFSNVSIEGTVTTGTWIETALGVEMPSNDAAPVYVVLNESAAVYHDNPDVTVITEWEQWNIDLQAFADLGVNLADVDSIGIGIGDRDNPTPGGSGTLYIDDIRLYRPPVTGPEQAP